jgi:hypothetical protein
MDLQLTIDCVDSTPMVEFWSVALDYVPAPPPEGHASWREYYLSVGVPEQELPEGDCTDRIVDPSGEGIRIWFQTVPEPRSPGKNRLHLDLYPGGGRAVDRAARRPAIDARVAELVGLGATVLHTTDDFTVLADPEGNEFCVS